MDDQTEITAEQEGQPLPVQVSCVAGIFRLPVTNTSQVWSEPLFFIGFQNLFFFPLVTELKFQLNSSGAEHSFIKASNPLDSILAW